MNFQDFWGFFRTKRDFQGRRGASYQVKTGPAHIHIRSHDSGRNLNITIGNAGSLFAKLQTGSRPDAGYFNAAYDYWFNSDRRGGSHSSGGYAGKSGSGRSESTVETDEYPAKPDPETAHSVRPKVARCEGDPPSREGSLAGHADGADLYGTVASYNIEEHKHRLAAWAAARAASASPVCRFTVRSGTKILEDCGFTVSLANPEHLPVIGELDNTHRDWRNKVIVAAKEQSLEFTHGIAAKLINCYLKVRFVCGGYHEHDRVACLHPPIDDVLLAALAGKNLGGHGARWKDYQKARWSKFDSDTYEQVIGLIRQSLPNQPLWMVESHWRGYQ